jgi:hypothetical protein
MRAGMDATRQEELRQRRTEVRAAHEAMEAAARIRFATTRLDERAAPYEVVHDTTPLNRWLADLFPAADLVGRIDWSRVPAHHVLPAEDTEAAGEGWIRAMAAEFGGWDRDAVLVWSNGAHPAIRLRLQDLAADVMALTDDFECWAICGQDKWVIEFTREDGWHAAAA